FQAEDGIRDFHVTGVQTCALPIFPRSFLLLRVRIPCKMALRRLRPRRRRAQLRSPRAASPASGTRAFPARAVASPRRRPVSAREIGRASCRERVSNLGVDVVFKTI